MERERPGIATIAGEETGRAMLLGFVESAAPFCLCDADDMIRHANAPFRRAFFPRFDGQPADFVETIVAAMRDGTGIRLVSATPAAFASKVREVRRTLTGSRSFASDMVDGSWWSVTDTKLSNGWTLAVAQDISALKQAESKLRDAHDTALAEARTDFLTGAPNRRHGLRRAEVLWKDARGAGQGLSMALLDIDHFKTLNDVYGHEAGDRALVHLSRCMMGRLGSEDQFSRLGGDEFMLVSARPRGRMLAAHLSAVLETMPALDLDGGAERLTLSVSAGVAESRADDTWAGLMHRADMALYDAKAGGRNRIALAA